VCARVCTAAQTARDATWKAQQGMAEMHDTSRKTHIVDADGIGQLSQLL
jgi:hypothetical protein